MCFISDYEVAKEFRKPRKQSSLKQNAKSLIEAGHTDRSGPFENNNYILARLIS